MQNSPVEHIEHITQELGPLAAADWLVEHFRKTNQLTELFEAIKMRLRLQLGLSPVASESESQGTAEHNDALERGLIEACREVGSKFLRQGKLEEGWMYMRAVGDLPAAADALRDVPVTDENLDTMLALLVQEGIDPGRGTELCLKHRGTCNTITMMDSVIAMRGRHDQQAAVAVLVKRVHDEVLQNVISDIEHREGKRPSETTLTAILEKRPDMLQGGAYHLDTTHIASTVRFARVLDQPEALRLALDLAVYGRHLHSQYQYNSEEPFEPLYPMSIAFFRALLGEKVEQGLQLFLRKAEELPTDQFGSLAIETYIDLLARLGRFDEALRELLRRLPPGTRPMGIAPSLLELSRLAKSYEPMRARCKEIGTWWVLQLQLFLLVTRCKGVADLQPAAFAAGIGSGMAQAIRFFIQYIDTGQLALLRYYFYRAARAAPLVFLPGSLRSSASIFAFCAAKIDDPFPSLTSMPCDADHRHNQLMHPTSQSHDDMER